MAITTKNWHNGMPDDLRAALNDTPAEEIPELMAYLQAVRVGKADYFSEDENIFKLDFTDTYCEHGLMWGYEFCPECFFQMAEEPVI